MRFGLVRFLSIPFIALGNLLRKEKKKYLLDRRKQVEQTILSKYLNKGSKVISGPFKGLDYPGFESFSSTLIPKLIGTYESEIYADLEDLANDGKYDNVVIIGAADGYYAVGLAVRMPNTRVVGFDADPRALNFCKLLKERNHAGNLEVRGVFLDDTMKEFENARNLVICDVDGFEFDLFTNNDFVTSLKKSDIIIETHDYLDKRITPLILKVLSSTHDTKVIPYIQNKINELPHDIFKNANQEEKKVACLERIVDNKWVIARNKNY